MIQPVGVGNLNGPWILTQVLLDNQCFRYEYDERKRLVMNKVPGVGETLIVFDQRVRAVLSQNANQRNPLPGHLIKWSYIQYDNLNRPIAEGLWTNSQSQAFHGNQAKLNLHYPNLSGQTYEPLKKTFYDNYDWVATAGFPISGDMDQSVLNWLLPATSGFPYTQNCVQSRNVMGKITGTVTKITGTPNSIGTSIIYDTDGRMIQTQANNIFGDLDVSTFQYNFDGKVARTYTRHQNTGAKKYHVVTTMDYDALGRILKVSKTLNFDIGGLSRLISDHPIVTYEYDELGQVRSKKLGINPQTSIAPLTDLEYEYNVRGWLLSLNKSYLTTQTSDKYFEMELG